MPVLFTFGMDVRLPEYPERTGAFREVVLVCDGCARMQDGLAEDASEDKWTDQTTYLVAHHVSSGDVWWCHTICRRCETAL